MEAARNMIPSPPSKIAHYSSSSASVLHEQVNSSFAAMPTASSTRYFPASVLIQEQREECKPLFHSVKEDKLFQGLVGTTSSSYKDRLHSNQDMNDFQMQMLQWPASWYLLPSFETKKKLSQSLILPSDPRESTGQVELESVVQLARKALAASKEAASLVSDCKLIEADLKESLYPSILVSLSVEKEIMVRSTRLHQRRSKNRRVPIAVDETRLLEKQNPQRKKSEMVDQSDPLRLFLSCGETKLLTLKEECETIEQIQALLKLQELRSRLKDQFARDPTFAEWAAACGLDCRKLKSELFSGQSSREKLIYANFRMVVHVAKQYQGRGLSLEDLLQVNQTNIAE
ncbi:hypothetical protein Leryth_026241 [Lithospermum erythrorhizon]|nr:hypothetical protein Leryth_026241 [Lithospermum erythrorhizon]